MAEIEKKLSSKLVYDGKVVHLFEDEVECFNGTISTREIVKHQGGVCILGFVNDLVILEKQYRYAYDEILYELPAGKLEKNENPLEAAKREFEEETGYKANELVFMGHMYPTCGYSNEIIYLYLAKNISKSSRNLDDDESIDIIYLPIDEVIKLISEDKIKDAKTICLISKYLMTNKKYNV